MRLRSSAPSAAAQGAAVMRSENRQNTALYMVRVIKLVGERRQQTKLMPSTGKWGQDKMADDGTSDWSGMTA